MDETRAERRYLLADELPDEPDERQCEEFDLMPVEVPRHACIGVLDAEQAEPVCTLTINASLATRAYRSRRRSASPRQCDDAAT